MSKFHVNLKSGNPGVCKAAEGKCPFGADTPHFSDAAQARAYYEKAQETFEQSRLSHVLPNATEIVKEIANLTETFNEYDGGPSEEGLNEYLDDYVVERWEGLNPLDRQTVKNQLEVILGEPTNMRTDDEPWWVWSKTIKG